MSQLFEFPIFTMSLKNADFDIHSHIPAVFRLVYAVDDVPHITRKDICWTIYSI